MPLPDGDTHIVKLWYSSDSQERSAVLEGALQGEDRKKLWDELNEFLIEEGGEEGDENAEWIEIGEQDCFVSREFSLQACL